MLLGIGLLGLWGMSRSNAALKTVYEDRTVPMEQLADINALQLGNRLALTSALLQTLPAAEAVAQVEANMAKASKLWEAYMATQLTDRRSQAREGRRRQHAPGSCRRACCRPWRRCAPTT